MLSPGPVPKNRLDQTRGGGQQPSITPRSYSRGPHPRYLLCGSCSCSCRKWGTRQGCWSGQSRRQSPGTGRRRSNSVQRIFGGTVEKRNGKVGCKLANGSRPITGWTGRTRRLMWTGRWFWPVLSKITQPLTGWTGQTHRLMWTGQKYRPVRVKMTSLVGWMLNSEYADAAHCIGTHTI